MLILFLALVAGLFGPAVSFAESKAPFLTPASRPLTLPKGTGEVGMGFRNAGGDYTYDLDGSHLTGEKLLPFRAYRDRSLLLTAAYGLTDRWEIGMETPYTWRLFTIDRRPLIDTEGHLVDSYPASRTHGLGDAKFYTRLSIRPWLAGRIELKTASGSDNFFPSSLPGSRPAQYIGSGQPNLSAGLLFQRRGKAYGLTGEVTYRRRQKGISNYLLRDYKPYDELVVNGDAALRVNSFWGTGAGFRYLHQASASSVSVLYAVLPVWFELGPLELRGSVQKPIYGKDYPALFPEQLADPHPLMGPVWEALLVYRWN